MPSFGSLGPSFPVTDSQLISIPYGKVPIQTGMNWVDSDNETYRPTHAAPPGAKRRRDLLLDELTGLPDWLSMKVHLDVAVRNAANAGPRPALIVLDVDGFSVFTERHGARVADRLLRTLATRVRALVDGRGCAYRTGADRIAIILDQVQLGAAVETAESAAALAARPLDCDGGPVTASACAALVMLGERRRADEVVRDVDLTMYRAKSEGPASVAVYSDQLDSWATTDRADKRRLIAETERLRAEIEKIRESGATDLDDRPASGETFKTDHARLFKRLQRSGDVYSLLVIRSDGSDVVDDSTAPDVDEEKVSPSDRHDGLYRTVRRAVRQGDQVYDLCDGRFAVLLTGAQGHAAVLAAERVRAAVERSPGTASGDLHNHGSGDQGESSVTVAAVEAGFRHESSRDVFDEANALLTSAEEAGPNRVVWPRRSRQETNESS